MKTEVLSYRSDIPVNSIQIFKERIKSDGQIKEIRVRFYSGQERSLRVRPYVLHKGHKEEDILTYVVGTEPYLSGEDDYNIFPCMVDVEYDDEFVVWVQNNDLSNIYTLSVDVVVNYHNFQ